MQTLDATGLKCPLPVLKAAKAMKTLSPGVLLEVLSTDPGSVDDFEAYARTSRNVLVEQTEQEGIFRFVLRRGGGEDSA